MSGITVTLPDGTVDTFTNRVPSYSVNWKYEYTLKWVIGDDDSLTIVDDSYEKYGRDDSGWKHTSAEDVGYYRPSQWRTMRKF
jgi:hypothetical protein